MPEEYIVVLTFTDEPIVRCEPGESLPLHMTLMPWFEFIGIGGEQRLKEIVAYLASHVTEPLQLLSLHRAWFGPEENVPVHVLERTDRILNLHASLYYALAFYGSVPHEQRWVGTGFRPHVSDHRGEYLAPGHTAHAQRMCLYKRTTERIKILVEAYSLP